MWPSVVLLRTNQTAFCLQYIVGASICPLASLNIFWKAPLWRRNPQRCHLCCTSAYFTALMSNEELAGSGSFLTIKGPILLSSTLPLVQNYNITLWLNTWADDAHMHVPMDLTSRGETLFFPSPVSTCISFVGVFRGCAAQPPLRRSNIRVMSQYKHLRGRSSDSRYGRLSNMSDAAVAPWED